MFYVICENIRSIYNVGSIFRTSDGLGVDKIFLCGFTGTPEHPRINKTALGAEKVIDWEHRRQTWRVVDRLKRQGVKIIALEKTKNSVDIRKFKPKFPLALVVGNEIKGVSRRVLKRCDAVVHIPMIGIKESYNVASAFAIGAWEVAKARKLPHYKV
jgi:tRNA G18 (ribose-2'-O)-methylase SpoU